MLTFTQWIIEARYQPEEEVSYVWHPFYGVHSENGYMRHNVIFNQHPELKKIPSIKNGEETQHDYDPPRGTVLIDRPNKTLHLTRYDQSKFGIKGTKDSADAHEIDNHIRKRHNVPADYNVVLHSEPHWWHNSKDFLYKN